MNLRTHNPLRRRGGFTLLELLLAMTIGAVVAAMALGLMRAGLQARRIAQESAAMRCELFTAVDRLARSLACAAPPGGVLAGAFSGPADLGDADEPLAFYYAARPGGFGGDLVRAAYVLEGPVTVGDDQESYVLVRYTWRNLLSPRSLDGTREVLLRGVDSVTLRYFDGENFQDRWESSEHEGALPLSVEITLTLTVSDTLDEAARDAADRRRTLRRLAPVACAVEEGRP